jgi:4-amino-4-deoxy-L-arabinose transferase-like glycosyltransferase
MIFLTRCLSAAYPINSWISCNLRWVALVCLLLGMTALQLLSLLRTPAPFVDEAWYACRAWALLQTGRAFGSLDGGVFDRFDGYWTYFPLLGTYIHALAIQAFGLSLFSVRLVSLVFGSLLLVAVFVVGNYIQGSRVALLAVGLVGLSRAFIYSSHLARQDIMVATLGFCAIALYLSDRRSTLFFRSLLAGLLVGFAFEIHPNGAVYGLALLTFTLFDYGRSLFRAKRLWMLVTGMVIGLCFFAALHVVPYPETYAAITRIGSGPTHTPPILTLNPIILGQSIVDTGVLFGRLRLLLLGGSVLFLLTKRSESGDRLLFLFGTLMLAFIVLVRNKADYYEIIVSPAVDLLIAASMVGLFKYCWRKSFRMRLLTLIALIAVVGSTARNLTPMLNNPMDDYERTLSILAKAVPPGASVMGPQTYWFGLSDRRYISWEGLVYYHRYSPESALSDAFKELHPEFLIIDQHMDMFIVDDVDIATERLPSFWSKNYMRSVAISKTELERLLTARARVVSEVSTKSMSVRVYEMDSIPE